MYGLLSKSWKDEYEDIREIKDISAVYLLNNYYINKSIS